MRGTEDEMHANRESPTRFRRATRRRTAVLALGLLLAGLAACRLPAEPPPGSRESPPQVPPAPAATAGQPATGPRLLVLGSAQDGGLPHAACSCPRCEAARRDPQRARQISSLAVLLPTDRRVILVDATPDIRVQLDALRDVRSPPAGRVDRAPVDGVLLTHAHLGHYTGLAFFGFEALHTRDLPVWCTPAMAAFLRDNGPWSQLVALGNIALHELVPGAALALGDGVTVTPIRAPHRDEYADTVGFVFAGPRTRVLYVPDTDSWTRWSPPIEELLRTVDVALLDGTFYSLDELPGRAVSTIGHPLIADSMERFAPLVTTGAPAIHFTHLNHSNPAVDADGAVGRAIASRGFHVVTDGAEFEL